MADFRVKQNTTFKYTVTFKDEDSAAIAESAIDSITMTHYDRDTGEIINSRDAQDVHDTNNCTYGTTDGLFTWTALRADTPIVNEKCSEEIHVVLLEVNYGTTKYAFHEFEIIVTNTRKVGDP
jgi:hypothetical protein